jgi:AcrR family transcriptional regulator
MTTVRDGAPRPRGGGVRRTQEQRSAHTRDRLLDATIRCLVQYGYTGTTTPRVVAHAGVTRGAQGHHFHSKNDLVIAAVHYLAERRAESAIADIEALGKAEDPVEAVLRLIWDIHQGPLFVAAAELWMAGRTDAALAAELATFEQLVDSAVVVAAAQVLPESVLRRDLLEYVYTVMDIARGIMLSSYGANDPENALVRWRRATARLRRPQL